MIMKKYQPVLELGTQLNIQNGDVIICISKSGNTPEVKVLIPFIKNIS